MKGRPGSNDHTFHAGRVKNLDELRSFKGLIKFILCDDIPQYFPQCCPFLNHATV